MKRSFKFPILFALLISVWLTVSLGAFAQRTVQLDEEFDITAGQDPERITIPVPGSQEIFYFDITASKEDAVVSLSYYEDENPYPDADHPGDKAVLFLGLNISKPIGSGVPIINFALRYRYGDSTPKMLDVDRNDIRFGRYVGDSYVLFMPGADNSDPYTRTITQGIATTTDITSTSTTLGLFSGDLVQDIYDKFDTVYPIAGAGRHQFSFLVSASERDELYLDILTENTNFNFQLVNIGSDNFSSSASPPSGTDKALVIVKLDIVDRAQVPVYNAIIRYHYDTQYTAKISDIDRETLQWALYNEGSGVWVSFHADQEKENNLVTSNVIQTGSSLIDLDHKSNILGLFAKSGRSGGGGGGSGGSGGGGGGGGGGWGDGDDGSADGQDGKQSSGATANHGLGAIAFAALLIAGTSLLFF